MIDGHCHPAASILHHGASDKTFRRLYHFVKNGSLDWHIGMVFVEIVQPTVAAFHKLGVVSVGVDALAHPVPQAATFSTRVEKWSTEMSKKRQVCDIQLPPLEGQPLPIPPEQEIGLRLIRRR